jgi:hypothetical protein
MKTRIAIPAAIKTKVLAEFNHRCAKCGTDRPQLHHIDENPSNNDPLNLIPLCPNCHLIDQHNPTRTIEPKKLMLFRLYKDPTILKPQFHPLFVRLHFLDDIRDDWNYETLRSKIEELRSFIEALPMGSFYTKQLGGLTELPSWASLDTEDTEIFTVFKRDSRGYDRERQQKANLRWESRYREQVRNAKPEIYNLIMELIRFQNW